MKITTAIASSTHCDRHNERMTKSALDGMAEQIKKKLIPQLIEHDPNQHIGVVLYGEVFQLKDGEFALGVVLGIFENNEKSTFKMGQPNNIWQNYKKYLDINKLKRNDHGHQTIRANYSSKDLNTANLLETHLDSTQVSPDGTVYKIKHLIASVKDLNVEIFPGDHGNPSHFHVISKQRNINAKFNIETLELSSIKSGEISSKDIKKIKNFFKQPEMLTKLKNEHKRLAK